MNRWRWSGALVLVASVAFGVSAFAGGAADRPVFKGFEGDKPFWQELKTVTTQTMKVQGQEVVQKQTQTFYVEWTPKGKTDKGAMKVEYKIIGVKMDIQIGGNNISYDSTAKDPPQNPLTDFFKALVGSSFNMVVETDPKEGTRVTEVDNLDAFINKLSAANEQLKPLLKSILDKEAIKQMSNPTFAAFPKTDKDWTDKKWTSDVKLNMGPIGSYDTKYTYTVNDKDKTQIDVAATMTYAAPKGGDGANLPFIIKSGKLETEKAAGTIKLDTAKGNIKSSEMTMSLKGTLTIDIAGMETVVDLNQTQTSNVATFYENPLKK